MIVAPGAAERQSHPDRPQSVDSIDDVLDDPLVGNRSAFRVDSVVAAEPGRNLLTKCRVGQHVPSKLVDRELIERLTIVQRLDQPVTPRPHVSNAVVLVAIGVCVPSGVEPGHGHMLAVAM